MTGIWKKSLEDGGGTWGRKPALIGPPRLPVIYICSFLYVWRANPFGHDLGIVVISKKRKKNHQGDRVNKVTMNTQ